MFHTTLGQFALELKPRSSYEFPPKFQSLNSHNRHAQIAFDELLELHPHTDQSVLELLFEPHAKLAPQSDYERLR